jgi:hypothetical protein
MGETTGSSSLEPPVEPPVEPDPPAPDPPEVARAREVLDAVDFDQPATSRAGALLRILAWTVSLVALASVAHSTTYPLTHIPRRTALNGDAYDGHRYGLTLEVRKKIFAELARVEIAERKRAIDHNTWNGHLWSREDDRGHYEMTAARALATTYGITLTQVYMVLDEGIREKWPGPDGKPLSPFTPPQDPRNTW